MGSRRTAVVTGGSRGIGAASALALAADGWEVAVVYRSRARQADGIVEEILGRGGTARAFAADVSNEADVRRLFTTVRREMPSLGAVVSSAGITKDGYIRMMSLATWNDVLANNLTSTFLVAREAARAMRKSGGSLVFVSSVSGLRGQPGQANYSASKGAINALTRTLARELAPSGVRVNAVAPGFCDTDMVKQMPRDVLAQLTSHIPLGHVAEPAQIASAIRFLVSEESSYITGQVLVADGGLTA